MATLLARMLILGVLVGARAQSDFCEGFPAQHQLQNVEYVEEQVQLKYLKPGDPLQTPRMANKHDLLVGNCSHPGPRVIEGRQCAQGTPGQVTLKEYRYTFLEDTTITCVRVLDRYEDGRGGFPFLVSGGPGSNLLRVNLYSQQDEGVRFYTQIYFKFDTDP